MAALFQPGGACCTTSSTKCHHVYREVMKKVRMKGEAEHKARAERGSKTSKSRLWATKTRGGPKPQ
eukprot:1159207-Pelagomonas_calceolata.AAC.6